VRPRASLRRPTRGWLDPKEGKDLGKKAGMSFEAIREMLDIASRETIASQWFHDKLGVPFFRRADGKSFDVAEYVADYTKRKPHTLRTFGADRDEVAALRERAFGPDWTPQARGEYVTLYGQRAFDEEMKLTGSTWSKKNPPAANSAAPEKPAGNLANNPYSNKYSGTPAQASERIAGIFKMPGGLKLAESLAKSAGTTVLRPLLKGMK
jgi:hypothetical protein